MHTRRETEVEFEILARLSGTLSVFVCVTFLNSLYDSMLDAHTGTLCPDSVFGSRDGYSSGSLVWKTIVSSSLTLYPHLSPLLLEPPLSSPQTHVAQPSHDVRALLQCKMFEAPLSY